MGKVQEQLWWLCAPISYVHRLRSLQTNNTQLVEILTGNWFGCRHTYYEAQNLEESNFYTRVTYFVYRSNFRNKACTQQQSDWIEQEDNLSNWPTECTNSCFSISLLYSSTCFEHCCAHHQEVKFYYTASGRPVHSLRLGRPPRECDDAGCCIIQFDLLMMSTTVLETCRRI